MIPIIIDDPNTWATIQVPQEIVRACENFTSLNPYNDDNTVTQKLRLIDCYWYNMEYYDSAPPLFPLFK